MLKVKNIIIAAVTAVFMVEVVNAADVVCVSSTIDGLWTESEVVVEQYDKNKPYDARITRYKEQCIEGFGGCLNELGWIAINNLSKPEKERLLNELFTPGYGVSLTYNRLPIGANDFATSWYSLNDTENDFEMKHFTIKRDKGCLLKYVKAALKKNPKMKLWASPWSPPVWMKTNHHYSNRSGAPNDLPKSGEVPTGNDQVIQDAKYLKAYALYFSKYIDAYAKEGVNVGMIQFQNEPYTFNIWPNTSWTPKGMANFLGNYLGPLFAQRHSNVALWLGTLNTDRLEDVDYIMATDASKYISGMGFQWEGKDLIGRVHKKYPAMRLMETENECGGGEADWGSAEHTFDLMKKYLDGGASIYTYFNLVLQDDCKSTWGWRQNAMVIVDSKTKTARYTPEFYVFKHVSHYVMPGAYKLNVMGCDGSCMAFVNPDGSVACVVANKQDKVVKKSISYRDKVYTLEMKPKSFNTIYITK